MEKIDQIEIIDNKASSFFVSFTDVVLLLLVFFVYLYSISTINTDKFERISDGVKQNLGFFDVSNRSMQVASQDKNELVQLSNQSTDLDNDLLVSLSQDVLFLSGSTRLTADAKAYLTKLAHTVKDKPVLLIVEGHADRNPIRSDRYASNWQLSASRAAAVCAWLEYSGVSSKYLKAVSYGPSRPKSVNDTRLDRRVEIFLKPFIDNKELNHETF